MDAIADAQEANPRLFVRGALTDQKAAEEYNVQLYHRTGTRPDATVVPAASVNDEFAFWRKELLKASPTAHAIIHDKVVVVDPFSPDCAVITGSHNLGYKASYSNDENLLILRGQRALAESYTTHVMDVYDHYRWRYTLQTQRGRAWSGLERTDGWQDKYFDPAGRALTEIDFWSSAG
jgi:phosphatidylserine/phosphatidylglycerophosphate/cardiolipin synthase-like enzyme